MDRPRMIDPRQPRVGQAVTGTVLAVGFVLGWPAVLPVIAVVLGAASLLGGPFNPYVHVFRGVKRALGWGPPAALEDAAPPRFANLLGFVFTAAASVLYYAFDLALAAWTLGVLVAVLALLAATTGLCVGCEFYVVARRIIGARRPGAEVRTS
jgi:uncharacterized protein DUF4395